MSSLPDTLAAILRSKKYRSLDLPESTLLDLYNKELERFSSPKDALDSVRRKLHNIVAAYLGDPDFPSAAASLDTAFKSGGEGQVRAACFSILECHASTRERAPHLAEFYARIFEVTGKPGVILDLACGLNPFAFPWMRLPAAVRYHAYDLNHPRVDLIAHFFRLQGLAPLAECRDILVSPPEDQADVAFFFKEAHRFEQRQRGSNRPFWEAVRARWLVISLPAESLTGRYDLSKGQHGLVERTLKGLPWKVADFRVGNELVFCVDKNPAGGGRLLGQTG